MSSERDLARQRALALLAKSLKKSKPSEASRAEEERDFLRSALRLGSHDELLGALRDRLSVLDATAGADDAHGGGGVGTKERVRSRAAEAGSDDTRSAPRGAPAAPDGADTGAAGSAAAPSMRAVLEAWRSGDFETAAPELLTEGFWRELTRIDEGTPPPAARPLAPPAEPPSAVRAAEVERMRAALHADGFFVSAPDAPAGVASHARAAGAAESGWSWGEDQAVLERLARAAHALRARGWPPAFVFMLREAWALADRLWPLLAPLLQAAGEGECGLDPSPFCWIAAPPAAAGAAPSAPAGANFGTPHRDFTALESWAQPGAGAGGAGAGGAGARPLVLSVWLPLTDVSAANGAMHVLPREFDRHFLKRWAYAHMRPALVEADPLGAEAEDVLELRFDLTGARQLAPAEAGTLMAWAGNVVHWGGRCASGHEPRVSVGFNFVAPGSRLQSASAPLSRAAARQLDVAGRLRAVAASLIGYSPWYELDAGLLPRGALRAASAPRGEAAAAGPSAAGTSAAGAPSSGADAAGPAPTPAGAAATATIHAGTGAPVPVGVRADGQPQYVPDSVRAALYAKYGDISQIKGDPSELEGNCPTQ